MITCIYCGQLAPASREHVLLEGLGGSTTIPWVCGRQGETKGCNQQLGDEIDRQFLRETPWALHRLLSDPTSSKKGYFMHRPDLGGYFDLERGEPLPQVCNPGRWSIIATDRHPPEELAGILADLPDQIHYAEIDAVESEPTRLVLKDGKLKIRARTAALARDFESNLRGAALELASLARGEAVVQTPPETAALRMTTWCDPNAPPRCAAKMTFNLLALHFGPDFIMQPAFNGIREYIAGRDVQPVETVQGANGEEGWTVDIRYVCNWLQHPGRMSLPFTSHALLLTVQEGRLFGQVFLWGRDRFVVRLPALAELGPLPKTLPVMLTNTESGDVLLEGLFEIPHHFDFLGIRSQGLELDKHPRKLTDE